MMARTERRNYCDEWAPETRSRQLKHCPYTNCDRCHIGKNKRVWNRWFRRAWKGKEDE